MEQHWAKMSYYRSQKMTKEVFAVFTLFKNCFFRSLNCQKKQFWKLASLKYCNIWTHF